MIANPPRAPRSNNLNFYLRCMRRESRRMRLGRRLLRAFSLAERLELLPEELARPRRSLEFYEAEAAERRYYYYVDLQGALFLDEHDPKGITTSLKDPRFLDFFFSRVRPNGTDIERDDFPWLSPCGKEQNYIRCADTPVVFTELRSGAEGPPTLRYAHSLRQSFRFSDLRVCEESGRLYHLLERPPGGFALIRSAVVQEFAHRLHFAGTHFELQEVGGGATHRLAWLPRSDDHGADTSSDA